MGEYYLKKIIKKEQLSFIQNLFKKEDRMANEFWRKKERGAIKVNDEDVVRLYNFLREYYDKKAKGKKLNLEAALQDIEDFFNNSDKSFYTFF